MKLSGQQTREAYALLMCIMGQIQNGYPFDPDHLIKTLRELAQGKVVAEAPDSRLPEKFLGG